MSTTTVRHYYPATVVQAVQQAANITPSQVVQWWQQHQPLLTAVFSFVMQHPGCTHADILAATSATVGTSSAPAYPGLWGVADADLTMALNVGQAIANAFVETAPAPCVGIDLPQ